jgi:hypothetical protein
MKLRLKVASPAGESTTFEHPGPTVRIGREPSCDLAMNGAASANVSREHARIDMTERGAVLADLGSSNGTLLNDEPVVAPRPLQVGDRIQLGYTGSVLFVMDLDLSPPAPVSVPAVVPAPEPEPTLEPESIEFPVARREWRPAMGMVALIVLVLAAVLVFQQAMRVLSTVPSKSPDSSPSTVKSDIGNSEGNTTNVLRRTTWEELHETADRNDGPAKRNK